MGKFYYFMGIIIYYSRCNLLFPWANSYYCMRKSVFYLCAIM